MAYWLKIEEEIEISRALENPHFSYVIGTLTEKKRVARLVLSRPENELLFIDKSGFCVDAVFAGISEKHIEYFAKHAPVEYKKEIATIFKYEEMKNDVWEIAKSMDDDEDNSLTRNQERIKRVAQYIQDNRVVFQF